MERKTGKIFTILVCAFLLFGFSPTLAVPITAPLNDWMPPTSVEWTSERGSPKGSIAASPIPNVNETLWISNEPAKVFGFSIKTERDLFPIAPLTINETIILYDSEYVFALHLENGTVKWGISVYDDGSQSFPWYVNSGLGLEVFVESAAIHKDRLYVATSADLYQEKGKVVALEAQTGSLIWIQNLTGTENTKVTSNIVAVEDQVFVGTIWSSHRVYSLNATTGNLLWNTTLTTSSNIRGIAVAQNMVFATNEAGEIYALDAKNGQILWSTNPGSLDLSIPVFYDGFLYLTSGTGALIKIDPSTGAITKQLEVNAGYPLPPQIYDNKILIAQTIGSPKALVALDLNSWDEIWRFTDPAVTIFDTPPIITTGTIPKVVVGAKNTNYTVFAIFLANGSLAWKYTLPARDFILSASQGKLVLAQRGENRWEGTVRVFGELESPAISNITLTPSTPRSSDTVKVSCVVTDEKSGVYRVILAWSLDSTFWSYETMSHEATGRYTAVLNPQTNGTTVICKIIAIDNVGNWDVSDVFGYTVFDPATPLSPMTILVIGVPVVVIGAAVLFLKRKK